MSLVIEICLVGCFDFLDDECMVKGVIDEEDID